MFCLFFVISETSNASYLFSWVLSISSFLALIKKMEAHSDCVINRQKQKRLRYRCLAVNFLELIFQSFFLKIIQSSYFVITTVKAVASVKTNMDISINIQRQQDLKKKIVRISLLLPHRTLAQDEKNFNLSNYYDLSSLSNENLMILLMILFKEKIIFGMFILLYLSWHISEMV